MAPRVLVSGASGFLGRHALQALALAGAQPLALVRDLGAWEARDWRGECPQAIALAGEPMAAEALASQLEGQGVVAVVHLAAEVHHGRRGAEGMRHFNVAGAVAMGRLAMALGCPLVVASSSGVVGASQDPAAAPVEGAPFARAVVGSWPYYASKIEMEEALASLGSQGLVWRAFRPPVMLGPGDHKRRSTGHVARVIEGKVPVVPPGGMHFVDVREVAAAVAKLALAKEAPPLLHLPGHAMPLADFFTQVARLVGRPAPSRRLPWGLVRALAEAQEGWKAWRGQPSGGLLPDPVVVEMAAVHWGLGSREAEAWGHRPRPAIATLRDTIADRWPTLPLA